MAWITPKTNWVETDRFNIEDFNRIKNNLTYLRDWAREIFSYVPLENMGQDIDSYTTYWDVDYFNAFEDNVEALNEGIRNKDYGNKMTFAENGYFINYSELNRIESATADMKRLCDEQYKLLQRLSFRLGTYRDIRI